MWESYLLGRPQDVIGSRCRSYRAQDLAQAIGPLAGISGDVGVEARIVVVSQCRASQLQGTETPVTAGGRAAKRSVYVIRVAGRAGIGPGLRSPVGTS